jgi:hypothetical protein
VPKVSITRVFYSKPELERWDKQVGDNLFTFTVFKWLRIRMTSVKRQPLNDSGPGHTLYQ